MTATTFDTAARLIGWWEPGSPQWHEARRTRVGGSEVAPILGLSPWDSYFSLWHRKRGAIGDIEETEDMRWGKRLEAPVCDEFADRHPELVIERAGTYVHPQRDWQLANPDRLGLHTESGEIVVVEAKVARFDDEWGEEGTDQIPLHYRAQVRWYLDTFGIERAYVPVLIGGSEFREYEVKHDPSEAEGIRVAVEAFLATIHDNVLPDIDRHTATYTALKQLHPDIDDVECEIPGPLAAEYQQACADLKTAEEVKQYAVNRICAHIGNARRAVCAGERIAIRVAGKGDAKPHLRPAQHGGKK